LYRIPIAAIYFSFASDQTAKKGTKAHTFGSPIWRAGDEEIQTLLQVAPIFLCHNLSKIFLPKAYLSLFSFLTSLLLKEYH
jgi:hypothetical protein